MSKRKNSETLEDQKDELLKAIDELRETLNLDDEDMDTIKDWGVAILITGVSAFVIYQLIKNVFGKKREEEEDATSNEADTSQISQLLKQQLAMFLTAYAKKKLNSFLESKGVANED